MSLLEANGPVRYSIISHNTLGNNTIVPAIPGQRIRVLSVNMTSAGTVRARFESGADGTALTGQMSMAANSQVAMAFNPCGLFETAVGALLNLELSAAISVDGALTYQVI